MIPHMSHGFATGASGSRSAATPAETETPAETMGNAMLDLAEQHVEALISAGLEAPLRARLARLLPEERVEPEPAPAATPPLPDPLDLAMVVTVCGELAKHKLSAERHGAIARLRDVANAWIAAINAARSDAPAEAAEGSA